MNGILVQGEVFDLLVPCVFRASGTAEPAGRAETVHPTPSLTSSLRGTLETAGPPLPVSLCPLSDVQKYRNTEIITVRVLDEAQHCDEALLTL